MAWLHFSLLFFVLSNKIYIKPNPVCLVHLFLHFFLLVLLDSCKIWWLDFETLLWSTQQVVFLLLMPFFILFSLLIQLHLHIFKLNLKKRSREEMKKKKDWNLTSSSTAVAVNLSHHQLSTVIKIPNLNKMHKTVRKKRLYLNLLRWEGQSFPKWVNSSLAA